LWYLNKGNIKFIIAYILLFSLFFVLLPEQVWLLAYQQEEELLLKQGKQFYTEGQFEEAIEKLSLAIRLLTEKNKLIDAYLHLALSYFALGEMDKAKVHLADILRLNPAHRLDPIYYSPDFMKLFDEAKTEILTRVIVESIPAGSKVFFNGKFVGLTPVQLIDIVAGIHKLEVAKEGYKTKEESFIVKEGEKKTISFELEEEEERPKVAATPPEERPKLKKKSNKMLWILLAGAAAVAVYFTTKSGGGSESSRGTAAGSTGTIRVNSNPSGAKIYIDGRDTGQKTNANVSNVSVGNHTVKLVLGGYKIWTRTVNVIQGQTTQVNANLETKMLTVNIKALFKMSNMRARWIIFIDDKRVLDEWITAHCRGGDNPDYRETTKNVSFQRKVGKFTLKLYGVDYDPYFRETCWIWPTYFELSIIKPQTDINLVNVSPNTFYLSVAPYEVTKGYTKGWSRQKTKTINLSPIGASILHSIELEPPPPIENKFPN
jgi:hypothetical protein